MSLTVIVLTFYRQIEELVITSTVFTRVSLSANKITQKPLIRSLWNFIDWLDMIQGPLLIRYRGVYTRPHVLVSVVVRIGGQLNGSVKEPNKFHNYETEKVTRKASDVAEYIELLVFPPEIIIQDSLNVILWTSADICVVVHDDLGWKNRTTRYNCRFSAASLALRVFSSAENVLRYMRRAWRSRVEELNNK